MKSVTFILKVITPLFMGGANQQAEIRTQSIKGLVRFWWRALKSENDIKKLRLEEVKIFGGQIKEKRNGKDESVAYKSKVNIYTQNINDEIKIFNDLKNQQKLQWYFNSVERKLEGYDRGLGYIFYSVLENRNSEKRKNYIAPDSKFNIIISSSDENALKQTLAAFWCAVYLGGFGARNRRGAGSVYVSEVKGDTYGISYRVDENSENVTEWLKNNFEKCQQIIGKPKELCYAYSNLSISRVIISKEKDNWKDALSEIGTIFCDFRTTNRSKIFESAAFGLPVMHRNGKVLTNNKDFSRRASPLILKVLYYKNKYYWMALRLAGQFLPEKTVLSSNGKTQQANYSLIDDFWNNLKNNNKELILQIPDTLNSLKKKLKDKGTCKIILFGSTARGDFKKNSDFDIAINSNIPTDVIGNYDIVNITKCNERLLDKIKKEGFEI